MKKMKLSSLVTGLFGLAALVAVSAAPAQAAFVVGGENGWQMSFDGMINVFAVYTAQSNVENKDGSIVPNSGAEQSFRVRTGLLPSIFAFNVKSPTINGVDYGARIGIYPQIENSAQHTGLGPNSTIETGTSVDFREIFLTADTCYGQLLAGRALNLYQGKNILTDMTLIGVGVPQNLTGLGVSLGFIGAGYTYASFGPQFRYTTPDIKGFKWAFEIADPSQIGRLNNADGDDPSGSGNVQQVNQPRFETELSYVMALPNGSITSWLAGIYQQAKFKDSNHKVMTLGGSGGVQAGFGPFGAVLSGWGGKGVGISLTQDSGAELDNVQEERISYGGLAQLTYTVGKAKIGAQYGINYLDRTDDDLATGFSGFKSNQAVTGGVYYSVNKYFTLVGEYTYNIAHNYDGTRQQKNIGAIGTVFVW